MIEAGHSFGYFSALQVPKVVQVPLGSLAGLDLLVFQEQLVMLDPLVSQGPLENKVLVFSVSTHYIL